MKLALHGKSVQITQRKFQGFIRSQGNLEKSWNSVCPLTKKLNKRSQNYNNKKIARGAFLPSSTMNTNITMFKYDVQFLVHLLFEGI